jgi:LPS export ABC transporter protein LptC
MRRVRTDIWFIGTAALAVLLSSCTNDLKKIQEISQKLVNSPADTTRGVDILYSDSAHVKAHILAPLMLEYEPAGQTQTKPSTNNTTTTAGTTHTATTDNTSRKVMPKGVKIIFYDKDLREEGNIIADTAYYFETQKLIEMRKNVVLTSAKGDVFRSEELNWDMLHDKITSDKPVDIVMANGNKSHGTSLETNKSFSPVTIQNQTGLIYIDSKLGQ